MTTSPQRPPGTVYWALTNACAHACLHCRHSSGEALPGELDDHELFELAQDLVALGVRAVVLTGGEPLLRPAWSTVAGILSAAEVNVRIHTSLALDERDLDALEAAGVGELAVSLDGDPAAHDSLRPTRPHGGGADHADTLDLLRRARRRGLRTRVVTTASRPVLRHLEAVYETVRDLGVHTWQLQQLHPTGRAADNLGQLLTPIDTAELMVRLAARAAREGQVHMPLHCTVGWLSSEEASLRSPGSSPPRVWRGSRAGRGGFFLSATGEVRGCPCLPARPDHAKLRNRRLAHIWADDQAFPETRGRTAAATGPCAPCRFAEHCQGGCTGLALGHAGTVTENPRCLRLLRGQVASSNTGA